MPKSTVTRKVSRLESQLGEKLLRRSTHRITVTELGERIYGHGLKILSEAHDVSATVEGIRKEPQGLLRAALPVFVGVDYASRVGAAFLSQYPKARLDRSEEHTSELQSLMRISYAVFCLKKKKKTHNFKDNNTKNTIKEQQS